MNSSIKVIVPIALVLSLSCTEHDRLKLKAQMGNRRAMYEYGLDLEQHTDNADEAIAWMTKAAEKGETEAMYSLAMFLSAGGESSNPKALYWFRKGSESGDLNCMLKLSIAYRYGYLGLEKDEKQYRYWKDKLTAVDTERSKTWRR